MEFAQLKNELLHLILDKTELNCTVLNKYATKQNLKFVIKSQKKKTF